MRASERIPIADVVCGKCQQTIRAQHATGLAQRTETVVMGQRIDDIGCREDKIERRVREHAEPPEVRLVNADVRQGFPELIHHHRRIINRLILPRFRREIARSAPGPDADIEDLRRRALALCDARPLYPGFRGFTTYVS